MRASPCTLLAVLLACAPAASDTAVDPHPFPEEVGAEAPSAPSLDGPTWVFFTDKGGTEAASLDPSHFHPSALERRRRNRPGRAALDDRDLPVHPAYLEALTSRGLQLRTTSRWLNAASVESVGDQSDALRGLPFVARLQGVARADRSEGGLWAW
ncbi:MAG: hypothetical protein VX498_00820, partial [Myxococcota bacterium]|nr:hypothetical protein [Myxococcota bacterium]